MGEKQLSSHRGDSARLPTARATPVNRTGAREPGTSGTSHIASHSAAAPGDVLGETHSLPSAAVVIGCVDGRLPASDRGAVALAATRFADRSVVWCPRGEQRALRYALGAGVRQATPSLDECTAQVILLGRGGAGRDADLAAASLAHARRAALVLETLDVEILKGALRVCRDLGRGAREIVTIIGPAVLAISDEAPQSFYVSRYRQAAVRIPPGLIATEDSAADDGQWGPLRTRTKASALKAKTRGDAQSRMFSAFGLSEAVPSHAQQAIVGDVESCARHLVRYLAHHGFTAPESAQGTDEPEPRPAPQKRGAADPLERSPASFSVHAAALRAPRSIAASGAEGAPASNAAGSLTEPGNERHARRLARRPRLRRNAAPSVRLSKLSRSPRRVGPSPAAPPRGPFPVDVRRLSRLQR